MTTSFPAFPSFPGIMWPVRRKPSGSTIRQTAISGKRTLLPQMVTPRWSWEIGYEFLRSAYWGAYTELEGLTAFYLAQMMAGTCFAYTDDEDNACAAQGFGLGDGTTTVFQLVRARGGFVEPVLLPTITQVTVAGTPTAAYTLADKGLLTFTVAPTLGQALAWTGTFSWLCRFDEDSLDLSRFMVGLSDAKSLKFSAEINP